MEMEEIPLTAPERQQTLESQIQRQLTPNALKRLLRAYAASPQKYGPVDEAIEVEARRYSSHDAQKFLNEFDHISRRPKARLYEIFDIFIRVPRTGAGADESIGRGHNLLILLLGTKCR